jgi:hypothetical protein
MRVAPLTDWGRAAHRRRRREPQGGDRPATGGAVAERHRPAGAGRTGLGGGHGGGGPLDQPTGGGRHRAVRGLRPPHPGRGGVQGVGDGRRLRCGRGRDRHVRRAADRPFVGLWLYRAGGGGTGEGPALRGEAGSRTGRGLRPGRLPVEQRQLHGPGGRAARRTRDLRPRGRHGRRRSASGHPGRHRAPVRRVHAFAADLHRLRGHGAERLRVGAAGRFPMVRSRSLGRGGRGRIGRQGRVDRGSGRHVSGPGGGRHGGRDGRRQGSRDHRGARRGARVQPRPRAGGEGAGGPYPPDLARACRRSIPDPRAGRAGAGVRPLDAPRGPAVVGDAGGG